MSNDKGKLEDLFLCVDAFAVAMKEKLLQKHREGFYGWNEQENLKGISDSLLIHATKQHELGIMRREEVDIANLAMMMWNLKGRLKS